MSGDPADRPVPPLGSDGKAEITVYTVGLLLEILIDAEKEAALEGQKHLHFYNATLGGVQVRLHRCVDGTLALSLQGLC